MIDRLEPNTRTSATEHAIGTVTCNSEEGAFDAKSPKFRQSGIAKTVVTLDGLLGFHEVTTLHTHHKLFYHVLRRARRLRRLHIHFLRRVRPGSLHALNSIGW